MLRAVAANTRAGTEAPAAVLTVRLPPRAGHNLALATELALAQPRLAATTAAAAADAPQTALERLEKPMTLVFNKDTLDNTVQMIAEEVGVRIEILGKDLELDGGITQNQSFALDERDKPAAAILRTVLAKANPDGKLVYVVRVTDGVESLVITTRSAAEKRGETLPQALQQR
jgi:hypothetical protein